MNNESAPVRKEKRNFDEGDSGGLEEEESELCLIEVNTVNVHCKG